MRECVAWAVAISLLGMSVDAQWINHPSPGIPRNADGKADLTAPAPRTADGKVDLSGIWERIPSARPPGPVPGQSDISRFLVEGSTIDMLPAAIEIQRKILSAAELRQPSEGCLLPKTFINQILLPLPIQIVQTPSLTLVLLEEFNHFRQVLSDGRSHPTEMNPSWFGYSLGRWDGNTFVVETRGFRDGLWLDGSGHVGTERLTTSERWERPTVGNLRLQLTVDDPGAFKRPWTAEIQFRLLPDTTLLEFFCENERWSSKRN